MFSALGAKRRISVSKALMESSCFPHIKIHAKGKILIWERGVRCDPRLRRRIFQGAFFGRPGKAKYP